MSESPSPAAPSKVSSESASSWLSFWGLALTQSMNSLNERGVQFMLVALGIWMATPLQYSLSIMTVLPFVIFAPLAGWFADRYCKTRLLQAMVFLQIIVLVGMFIGLYFHLISVAMGFFLVFCVQAVFFSPAKKGLVKDIMGEQRIGIASGILEITSMLALLFGQIGGLFVVYSLLSRWGEQSGWEAAAWPTAVCAIAAIGVFILSLRLPRYKPLGQSPFRASLFWEHGKQLKMLWQNKVLRHSQVGIGYFWFIAGMMVLIALNMAEEINGVDSVNAHQRDFMRTLAQQKDSALLIAWISGGSIMGGLIASLLCIKKLRMSIAYIGAIGMTIGCVILSLVQFGEPLFYAALVVTGMMAAGFLVPLNAVLQNKADNDKRGDVIAAGNLVDCFLGILAVLIQQYMRSCGMSTQMQCAFLALASLLITIYIIRYCRHV